MTGLCKLAPCFRMPERHGTIEVLTMYFLVNIGKGNVSVSPLLTFSYNF